MTEPEKFDREELLSAEHLKTTLNNEDSDEIESPEEELEAHREKAV